MVCAARIRSGSESAEIVFIDDLDVPFGHFVHGGGYTDRSESCGFICYAGIDIKGWISRDDESESVSFFGWVKHWAILLWVFFEGP